MQMQLIRIWDSTIPYLSEMSREANTQAYVTREYNTLCNVYPRSGDQ